MNARLSSLAAISLLLGACAAPAPSVGLSTALADSMVGRSASYVTERLGAPASRSAASLVYETRRSGPAQAQSGATLSLGGGASASSLSVGRVTVTCQWRFALDANAVVTGWQQEGALCAELG